MKNLYHCTGQTLAHRGGVDPKFGHDTKDELVAFKPKENKDGKFVNVDTTIKDGILRAKELGLVQSHMSDIIFTMEPTFAGKYTYSSTKIDVPLLFAVTDCFYFSLTTRSKLIRQEEQGEDTGFVPPSRGSHGKQVLLSTNCRLGKRIQTRLEELVSHGMD